MGHNDRDCDVSPGAGRVGAVGDGEGDSGEAVQGDDDQDEAAGVEAEDPNEDHHLAGEVTGAPGDCERPRDLQRNLQQDNLQHSKIGWDEGIM